MLSLDQYLDISKKILISKGYGSWIKSDDDVSYIAYCIMKADDTFNGIGHIEGWRSKNAEYGIKNLKTKKKREKKKNTISLFAPIGDNSCIIDLLGCESFDKDLYDDVIHVARKTLKPRNFNILINRFQNRMTLEKIGIEFGLTKERVRQILENSIQKVKHAYQNRANRITF